MALQFNGDQAYNAALTEAAQRLQYASRQFWQAHTNRLGAKTAPPHSKPGEYPRKITGTLIGNVVLSATAIEEILEADLIVKAGLMPDAEYGLTLEFSRNRLGFIKTMEDLKPLIKIILEAGKGA